MERFEYHQTAGLGLRTRAYYVHYKIGLPLSLLNKRQSHRLNANWLNCTLEFSRRKTYLLGERWKKDLLICLFTRRNSKTFFLLIIFSSYGKHASTISFYLYSSSQVERWSTLIDVAVVLLSYSPNSLFRFRNPGLASRSPNALVSG